MRRRTSCPGAQCCTIPFLQMMWLRIVNFCPEGRPVMLAGFRRGGAGCFGAHRTQFTDAEGQYFRQHHETYSTCLGVPAGVKSPPRGTLETGSPTTAAGAIVIEPYVCAFVFCLGRLVTLHLCTGRCNGTTFPLHLLFLPTWTPKQSYATFHEISALSA